VVADESGQPLQGVWPSALGGAQLCNFVRHRVRCWGVNTSGQLGMGVSTTRELIPGVVLPGGADLEGVQALALGGGHGCALLADNSAVCWGNNYSGQVGNGLSLSNEFIPWR